MRESTGVSALRTSPDPPAAAAWNVENREAETRFNEKSVTPDS